MIEIKLLHFQWQYNTRRLEILNMGLLSIPSKDVWLVDRSLLGIEFYRGTLISIDLLFFRWYSDAGFFTFFKRLIGESDE